MELLADTDILVGVTASSLSYIIYLAPDSVAIAYLQRQDRFYTALAEVSRVKFYPVYNNSAQVYIHFGQLHNYLRVAAAHIQIVKYHLSLQKRE